ncbi:MAG: prolipoprotein diacylglyceryl transferase [Mycobacterium sp.]
MTTTLLASFPSPSQGVWHLGPVPIRAYALFIIIGIIAALVIGDRRWEARGGERGVIYDIALWAVPFGLIGGRLYHVLTDWPTYFGPDGAGPMAALRIWDGGLGIWGAVALGAVGAWIGCRHHGIPLPAFGDAVAPGIVLAQAIGRMGNYFNQELYGRQTDVPWGMEIFYRREPSGIIDVHSLNGVSTGQVAAVVHPTFLYELLWNLLIFAALLYVDRRFKLGHGRLFALYVAGYCVGRFGVELMRDDFATLIAGIRINSFTATFVFIGAIVYVILAPKGREDPESLRGKNFDGDSTKEAPEPAPELVAVAATSGGVAAATETDREDEAHELELEPEPDVELEPDVLPAVEEAETGTDADVVVVEVEETPEDEAIVEAQLLAGGDLVVETAAEAGDAQLIDEDHDPVDEDDLESLQDDAAIVVDGPVSEQQEELDQEDLTSDLDDEELAADEAVEEPEVAAAESDEAAPDQADVEAEVTADGSVVIETAAETEDAELIDDDHDPVDAEDLESLQADDAVAGSAGPESEQQEELAETASEVGDDDAAEEAVEAADSATLPAAEAVDGEESDQQAELAGVDDEPAEAAVAEPAGAAPDQADVEAEVTADSSVSTETAAEVENAELIDEDHDPVDGADVESLQGDDAPAGADGPESEQQEGLDAEEVSDPDEPAPDETAPDETAPDETVPDETAPDETAAEPAVPPAPRRAWPTTATPAQPKSRLGRVLRRLRR